MEINYKYIAFGILVGYLLPYVIELMQNKKNTFGLNSQKESYFGSEWQGSFICWVCQLTEFPRN